MKKLVLFILMIVITTVSYGQRPTVEHRGNKQSTTAVRTKDRTSTQRNYNPVERRKPNKQVQHRDDRDNGSKPIKQSDKRDNKHHSNKPHHEKHPHHKPHHKPHISQLMYHPHFHTHVRMYYYLHNHFLYSNLYWYDIDCHRIKILSRETDGYYVYSLIRDKTECQSYLIISDTFDKVYAKVPVKRKYKKLMLIDNFVYLLTNSNDFIIYRLDLDNNQLLFFQEIID
jgi:hypothetical protein